MLLVSSLTSHTNHSLSTLPINVYLPTDYGTPESNAAYLDCLCELDGFISAQSFDNVIICGDFNVDFSRNNHNTSCLTDFMDEYNLVRADTSPHIQLTYRKDDFSASSWPDHVLTLRHNVSNSGATCLDSVLFDLCFQAPLSVHIRDSSHVDASSHPNNSLQAS